MVLVRVLKQEIDNPPDTIQVLVSERLDDAVISDVQNISKDDPDYPDAVEYWKMVNGLPTKE